MNKGFVDRYFKKTRRQRVAEIIESIGDRIIQLSVKVRNPTCRCKWCTRNFEAIINGCEEHGMEIADLRDQLNENLLICERAEANHAR